MSPDLKSVDLVDIGVPRAAGPASYSIEERDVTSDPRLRKAHASPIVRAFARELGVDLSIIHGSGPDRKSTRLNSSHPRLSRMPSSA